MLKQFSQNIVQNLWENYSHASPDMQCIQAALKRKGIFHYTLDHFAIIDLPSPHSGIPQMREIFSKLGYIQRGNNYLPQKQNDFAWMAEANCDNLPAGDALPQVVLGDFRLDEMPPEIRHIIYHYTQQESSTAFNTLISYLQRVTAGDEQAFLPCKNLLSNYFAGRDATLPKVKEFHTVREFNELLAWVLIFGRRPNHFTLSIHLLDHFSDLGDFHHFIENETGLSLNHEGGVIKGNKESGLAQGCTSGISQKIKLADGEITIPTGFVEFVWRYPKQSQHKPLAWNDYFTDFIAHQANSVVESLYTHQEVE